MVIVFLTSFTGVDAVGIFRKSGGKQRINHLKEMIEGDPGNSVCGMALTLPVAESKLNVRLPTRQAIK